MAVVFDEGDDVFYRGAQFPWGHAVVVHVSDAGYVLALDHCGEVVVGLDEVSSPPESSTVSDAPMTAPVSGSRGTKR